MFGKTLHQYGCRGTTEETMIEDSKARRKRLDHERYMRRQEERKASQRAYYAANRDEILAKKRAKTTPTREVLKYEFDVERKRAYHRAYYHNVTKPKRLALCHTI